MIYYRHPRTGIVRIAGPDQVDFLQRQTSNDLNLLVPERALPTVLTSPTARILDVFYLIQQIGIQAISLTGNGAGMAKYLKSRIFFMDHVTVEDLSSQYDQYSLFGANVEAALQKLGLPGSLEADDFQQVEFHAETITIMRHHPQLGLGYLALAPASVAGIFESQLIELGLECMNQETYEILRIENGLPAADHELSEEYTPFEVGLSSLVSTKKGCYTGQEILARQVTYDKIARGLATLKSDVLLPIGAQLKQDGKPAGTVTSSAVSPTLGPVALAVLRRSYLEPGTVLLAQDSSQTIQATICEFPFK
jgi:folate-binding protein YgfZ